MKRTATGRRRHHSSPARTHCGVARTVWAACGLALLAFSTPVAAQPLATVELGWRGVLVADSWNPVRVRWRDLGTATLHMIIERGTLAQADPPIEVTLAWRGGVGVGEVAADVYVPTFRRLSWRVDAGGLTVASGSVARDAPATAPVDLFVTPNAPAPGWSNLALDITADTLSERPASYSGVRSLWLTAEAARERPRAWVAAAAAGVVVVAPRAVLDDFPLRDGWNAMGAGGVWLGDPPLEASLTDARIPLALLMADATEVRQSPPPLYPPRLTIALLGALFAALVLGALRLPPAAGFPTLALAVVAAMLLAVFLSPDPARVQRALVERSLEAGGLALVLPAVEITSDRRHEQTLVGVGHLPTPLGYSVRLGATADDRGSTRWVSLRGRPVWVVLAPFVREADAGDAMGEAARLTGAGAQHVRDALVGPAKVAYRVFEGARW